MKKRVISLFMALVMCLSLVPTAVWAEAAEGVDNNVEQAGLYENKDENGAMEEQEPGEDDENALDSEEESDEPSIDVVRTQGAENGIAVQAAGAVAEVTIGSETKQYTDIDAAFAAAQEADSATVRLLADVTISHDGYSGIRLEKGDITLDLNGKTISKSKGDDNVFYSENAVFWLLPPGVTTNDEFLAALQKPVCLTVQDSAGGGKIVQPNGGPAIIVTLNTILTVKGGTVENTSSVDHDNQSHMAPNCAVLLSGGGKAAINGGTLSGMRGVAVTGYITKGAEAEYKKYFGIEGYNNDTYGNELTVTGGEISGTDGEALIVYEKAKKIELSGGTFTTQSNDYSIWVADTEPEGEPAIKGDAASLLASGYRFENNGAECAYSEDGNGVVGNATVKERPANEYTYIDKDGKLTTQANCTEITESTDDISQGWYVVKENVTISQLNISQLNISQEVNLILCDGATLTVSSHMNVAQGSTLNLYWQSAGSGKLTAADINVPGTITAPAGEMKQTTGEGGTTYEKCLTHEWRYTVNEGNTHTATCTLCGKDGGTAAHEFSTLKSTNETTHTFSCVCGKVSTENHPSLSESPNDDGLTHTGRCGLCGYSKAPEKHNFQYSGMCICSAHLTASYNNQSYATLASAVEAAKNGGTVTLERDVEESITITDGMDVTIDLNEKNWGTTHDTGNKPALTVNGGSVTVKNGTMHTGGMASACTPVVINGGSLTVGEGMTIQASGSGAQSNPAIEMTDGELTLRVGTKLVCGMRVPEGKQLKDYLPKDTAFQQTDYDQGAATEPAGIINGYVREYVGKFTLTVEKHETHTYDATTRKCECGFECTHEKFNNGVCETCGYVCAHPSDSVKNENDVYTCGVCGEQMMVKVEKDDSTTYYAMLYEAGYPYAENTLKQVFMNAESGSTVTLLADGLYASGWAEGKELTLNLNGKNVIENNGFVVESKNGTAGKLIVTGKGSSTAPEGANYTCTFRVLSGSELWFNENFSGEYGTIYLENGVLVSNSTNVKIGALVIQKSEAQVKLKGGQFGMIVTDGSITRTASSLLERYYAFQNGSSYVAYDTVISATSALEDVTVVKCDHQMTEMPTGNQYNKLHCPNCDEALGAVLTTADGKINGYEDLTSSYGETSALSVAETTPGCTVTMYYDADGLGIWSTKEGFTLDANGCKIGTLTLSGGTLTVKNATITGDEHTDDPAVMTFYRSDNIAALTLENCLVEEQKESGMATLTANGPVTLKSTSVNGKTSVFSITNEGLTVEESTLNGDVTVRGSLTFKNGNAGKITVYGAAEISDGIINELDCSDAGSLTVSGGHFGKITAPDGKQLIACLKDGYAFYSNAKLADGRSSTLEDVYAAEHTHGDYMWDTATHEKVCACGDIKETDAAAPTFGGIENGETYYQNTLTFTVEDAVSGVKEVKDGETVLTAENGKYTISADNKVHTITATDNAGNKTIITVTVNKVYTVTLPSGEGYTIDGESTIGYNQGYTFTVNIAEGYSRVKDSYKVLVNGTEVTAGLGDENSEQFTVTAIGDLTITVEGVADVTAPEAEMTIGANKFKELLNSLTFGLFFKETQTVTVTASDKGSGVAKAEYLVTDGVFNKDTMPADGWTSFDMKNGKGSFNIAPNAKGSVYVRVADEDGNVALINSEGVVVYTDSTASTEHITFTRLSDEDVSFKVNLNGNWFDRLLISDGKTTSSINGILSSDGTVTLKNEELRKLAVGEYTITVTYSPLGQKYVEADGNDAPAATTVKLTVVKRADRTLTFSAPDAVYDGAAYDDLRITDKPGRTTVHYKEKDADDSTYDTAAPKNAGSYTVKITVDADEDYEAKTFTKDFTISPKEVAIYGVSAADKTYDGTATATIANTGTLSGQCEGDELTIDTSNAKATFASKNAGTWTVTFEGFKLGGSAKDNYKLTAQPTSVTKDITRKALTVENLKVKDKVYDGTDKAELDGTPTLKGLVEGDTLILVNGTPTFDSKDVGTGKTVSFTYFNVLGDDETLKNYSLPATPTGITANITAKEVSISGVTVKSKTYDGSTAAEIESSGTLSDNYDGENLTIVKGNGNFADKNVGTGKTVSFSDFKLGGEAAGNYKLTAQPTSVKADITAKEVKLTGGISAVTREYEPNNKTVTLKKGTLTFEGLVSGEMLDVTLSGGTIETPDAGKGKTVTYTAALADGTNGKASNYKLVGDLPAVTVDIDKATQRLEVVAMKATYGDTFEVTPVTGNVGDVQYSVASDSQGLLVMGEDGKFTATSGTGTAHITATVAETDNYSGRSVDIPVELSKATLTVKAADRTMYVNGALPTDLKVEYSGFVGEDTKETVVKTDATARIEDGVDGKTPGDFAIIPNEDTELAESMAANYTLTHENGKLIITKRNSYYYAPSSDAKEQSPGTGDAGMLVYGLTALGGYTGTALVLRRRKRED